MTPPAAIRVMCVTPLGSQPWCTTKQLVAAIQSLGHKVVVVGDDAQPLPWPDHYVPSGKLLGYTPHLLRDRGREWSRFVRRLWTLQRRQQPNVVLVWDSALAVAFRATRRRGTRVIFVSSEYMPSTRRERLVRAAAIFASDGIVVPSPGASTINLARQIVVHPLGQEAVTHRGTDDALDGAWVVLAGGRPLGATIEALRAKAAKRRASAVVVDGRAPSEPHYSASMLAAAAGGAEVLVVTDDAWLAATGATDVIDPTASFWSQDHRHRAAFRSASLWVATGTTISASVLAAGISPCESDGEWTRLTRPPAPHSTLGEWVNGALTDPSQPRAGLVGAEGVAVLQCPTCGSVVRRTVRILGPTTIFRCQTCTLVYASPKVPDALVYDDGYHDGTGSFGTDYVHAQWYCERLSEDRIRCLERAGLTPGRMIDIGTGFGHFVAVARRHGWECDGLELVDAAVQQAKDLYGLELINEAILEFEAATPYDVAALGQTLEHFVDPAGVLEHVRERVLRPGGYVLLEVPHFGGLTRRLQGARWSHWQSGDHVLFLERKSVEALLNRSGYDLVHAETVSGVYPGLGAVGVSYGLGLFNPLSSAGSCLRTIKRVASKRLQLSRRSGAAASVTAVGPQGSRVSPGERLLLRLADRIDSAGLGDHLRVVARVR